MADLRKKLGMGGYHVWCLAVAEARPVGLVTLSRAEMCRARGLTVAQVKHGLKRLEEAGLMRSVGWRRVELPDLFGCPREQRVFARQVRGQALDPKTAFVPVRTWRWLRSAAGWGGARKGAGKPARAPSPEAFQVAPSSISSGPQRGGFECSPTGNTLGGLSPITITSKESSDLASLNPQTVGADLHPRFSTELGVDLDGELSQAPDREPTDLDNLSASDLYGHPAVPPRPKIAAPVVPAPALLDPSADPLANARILAKLYTTALQKHFGKRIWTFKHGVERSRYCKLLEANVAILIEKDIPPGQWVRWRLAQCTRRELNWRGKYPPVPMIFSQKAITKDRWKFRAFGEEVPAARSAPGPALTKLIRRWSAMERTLLREVPRVGSAGIPAIVDRFFPNGLYDRMAEAAELESVDLAASLRHRAASGEYLW